MMAAHAGAPRLQSAVQARLDRGVDATWAAGDLRLYGTTTRPVQENQMNLAAVPDDLNDAERLGLIVGQAYGAALAERDQARQVATEAIAHLTRILDTTPPGTFAAGNTAQDAARDWLAAVASTDTPAAEQETTQP